ncbi:MAG: hypothetical protein ACPKPY_07090 [Nitrososphaeraceae archaeon]
MSKDDYDILKEIKKRFDKKSDLFEKLFVMLLGLSLFILLFVLLPYVYHIDAKNKLIITNQDLNEDLISIKNMNDTVSLIGTRNNLLINQTGEDFNDINNILINVTLGKPYLLECNHIKLHHMLQCHIEILVDTEYELISNFSEQFIFPKIQEILKKNSWQEVYLSELNDNLLDLNGSYYRIINNFSTSDIQEAKIPIKLHEETITYLSNSSNTSRNILLGEITQLEIKYNWNLGQDDYNTQEIIQNFNNTIQNVRNDIKKTDNTINEIKGRADEFASPMGKLVLGFDEIILFFPLLLIGGYLVCIFILIEIFFLRKILFDLYTNQGISEEDISRGIPLWIDNKNLGQNKSVRAVILFIPMIIFFISTYLNLYLLSIPTESFIIFNNYFKELIIVYIIAGSIGILGFVKLYKTYNQNTI